MRYTAELNFKHVLKKTTKMCNLFFQVEVWEFSKLRFHKQVLKESLMKDTSWEMWLKLASSPVGSPALRKRQGYLNLGKKKKKKKRKGKEGMEKWKEKRKKGKKFWIDGIICLRMKVKALSLVLLLVTPWTVAYQAPQSMEFSRQEYWSGLTFPSPGDLPNPGIEPGSPALQTDALPVQAWV